MDGLPGDWRVVEPSAAASQNPPASPPAHVESNRLWLAVAGIGVAVVVAAGAWMLAGPSDAAVALQVAALEEPASPGASRPLATPARVLVVDVGGAVRRPGVYRLPDGARVVDAIAAAGGFAPVVDTSAVALDLNLAAALADGDRVRVPARGAAGRTSPGESPGGATQPASPPGDGLVDLNRASAAELEALPAIGPATAAKIIAAREEQPFASVEDLRTRKVLGAAAFGKVRDLVTVR